MNRRERDPDHQRFRVGHERRPAHGTYNTPRCRIEPRARQLHIALVELVVRKGRRRENDVAELTRVRFRID